MPRKLLLWAVKGGEGIRGWGDRVEGVGNIGGGGYRVGILYRGVGGIWLRV